MKPFAFFLLFTVFLFSCNTKKNGNDPDESNIPSIRSVKSIPGTELIVKRGESVYRKHCTACHQNDGQGMPKMYPPLADTKTTNGNKEKLIEIVLYGLSGEITVKGEVYNQVMIPHSFLSDKEIADVLSYVRKKFGNNADLVLPEDVAKIRENQ